MKNILTKLLVLLSVSIVAICQSAFAQRGCHPGPGGGLLRKSEFATDKQFISAHMNPLPFTGEIIDGEMVMFPCVDGKNASAFVVSSTAHPKDIVFMFHEWWGLNDYIKQEAVRLSKKLGVSVVAIDLYDGAVATTAENATKYMKSMAPERAFTIIAGAYNHFPADAHYATIGWCFGGGWSMKAAMNPSPLDANDKRIVGCIVYYGMPEMDQTKLARLHCPILGIFGKKDQWISPKVVGDFESAMKKAKKKLTAHNYDADHAFANPSNPGFDKEATEDAMEHTEKFLKKVFGL